MKRLPNYLSASRLVLAVAVCLAAASKSWILAWWLFIAAAFTDMLDGPLARKLNAVSNIGDRLDHWADLVLMVGALVGLTIGGVLPLTFIASIALSLAISFCVIALSGGTGNISQGHFAIGAITFVLFLLAIALVLVSKAYGWQWWYIPLAAGILAPISVFKRGRLIGSPAPDPT